MSKRNIFFLFITLVVSGYSQNIWEPTSVLGGDDYVQSIAVASNGTMIAASFYQGIYRSTNNGVNWTRCTNGTGVYHVSVAPDGHMFAVYYGLSSVGILRSTNDGVNWGTVYSNQVEFNYYWGGGIAYLPNGVYIASMTEPTGPLLSQNGAVIVRSLNFGQSWDSIFLMNGTNHNDFKVLGSRIYCACFGIAFPAYIFTETQGNSWVSGTLTSVGLGVSFKVSPSNDFYSGVATGDNVTEKLFKSTNQGVSWNQAGLPGASVNALFIASNGDIYAATEFFSGDFPKVRRSTDNSVSWELINSGLPANIEVHSFVENSNGDVFAGTRSAGIYVAKNILGIIKTSETVPVTFTLSQNYPNPFNPSTNIKFGISKSAFVTLKVYSSAGNEIETLVNQNLSAGAYTVDWQAGKYSSGIYFYKLYAGDFSQTKKMVYIK